jgi:SAM-dependent methyltransferase
MEEYIWVLLVIAIAFIFWVFLFIVFPLVLGASYEVTKDDKMKKMIKFAKIKRGDRVAELGSGNGKLVIEFAKLGAEVHGYEINPFLVLLSKWKIRREGLRKRAFIHWKNFWTVDLGEFDVILTFQVSYIMGFLEKKLKREAKKNIRIVSNNWKFPSLRCLKDDDKIYYYEIKG